MEILKLLVLFAVILVILRFKKPLWIAVAAACITGFFLYGIGITEAVPLTFKAVTSYASINTVLVIYLITFLQLLLEKRGMLTKAEDAMSGLFNNRRVNACAVPMFIGLMPAPSAVTLAAPIVDKACGDYLTAPEKTFLTSFYRHVPESSMPTYSSVLIACQLSGIAISSYIIYMIPMVVALIAIPYFFYLRKVPKETGLPPSEDKKGEVKNLLIGLWPIILIIALVVGLQQLMRVVPAIAAIPFDISNVSFITFLIIILFCVVNKVKFEELKPLFIKSIHPNMLLSSVVIMVFKDIITKTGVIALLPELFAKLPIPSFLVYALIIFIGTIVSGLLAILAIVLPLAFASIPGAGTALMVLFMCFGHASMQISPTHICLYLATDYFKTSMKDLLLKTVPVIATFCVVATGYYLLLNSVFGIG